ncbi:DEAD/DEAH box helicase family protein [Neolewinella lacunae]|uniref:DEAD/DEAH box helicase family protein n=1 Tax=Neolewinella lacunae TaxID=1517758 RepID=A0A923T9U2_9BACT|nr:DEAD/DEAH box helicase family protein [Neolewinella lacunae]MBC6995904.1 DEAD/DEAH box helicase family protein [Neolewinella lacunae]MDN3636403.1 DEAD/DEAH box helicase family protein [Neolewinella lacunae]
MNNKANFISNRLSLRAPQRESLDLLAAIAADLRLEKGGGEASFLSAELAKVKKHSAVFAEFERDFPSLTFSLATGVGKTRLAGAFIAYLHQVHGVNNFFVLAPNLTIYNKLIDDFGRPNGKKYVFKGLLGTIFKDEPNVITGDNYREYAASRLIRSEVNINVFNISKINSKEKGSTTPNIRKMAEYLGQSYFNYLAGLPDLVLVMDESHHYRADRGLRVLNELNPVLGLELTATPQVISGNKTVKFKNVVYEYSLAKAIRDGFVKKPAVTTRKDFKPEDYNPQELDRIKLRDGIALHEQSRTALDLYARENGGPTVKPFILVVAKDTTHASELKRFIQSEEFFEGRYADKVMDIHSSQKGSEKDDNIAQLVSLEDRENTTEIVIHVNMLKEGWDVTNLYTIVPLRASASDTLTEQTIGRGLRLPYGRLTGDELVDRLSIVAHDNFQAIVDEANKPGSIINKDFIIEIDPEELSRRKEIVSTPSYAESIYEAREAEIAQMTEPVHRAEAKRENSLMRAVHGELPKMNNAVKSVEELRTPEVRAEVVRRTVEKLSYGQAPGLYAADLASEVEAVYERVVNTFVEKFISIPRISITPKEGQKNGFTDFDLDVSGLNQQPVSHEILIREMQSGKISSLATNNQNVNNAPPFNLILNELVNEGEINYEEQKPLLAKLVEQAVAHYRSYLKDEEEVHNVVYMNRHVITKLIYRQMMDHFYLEALEFTEVDIHTKPFTQIEPHNYTKYDNEQIEDFKSNIGNASVLKMKLFTGFAKACHQHYKFDTYPEQLFAQLCEQDDYVVRWMRPARKQFRIYYGQEGMYVPDFVVECEDAIYMVEPKMAKEMEAKDVQDKAVAAREYCKYASAHTAEYGGKPWRYALVPHTAVQLQRSVRGLMGEFSN